MIPRIPFSLLVALIVLGSAFSWWLRHHGPPPPPPGVPVAPPAFKRGLSDLSVDPDWFSLEEFQGTITRSDFLLQMDKVYTVSSAWRKWFEVHDEDVKIFTDQARTKSFTLRFATGDASTPAHTGWRGAAELPPATEDHPLEGLKIAIDPGHIGGTWGKIEERWFQIPGGQPVLEGDMTLMVAQLLKPQLEALGATVTLVRDKAEPVTQIRPEMLRAEAAAEATPGADITRTAERLFYRTAEIRARARIVNEIIQPDLVLCLHFDADDRASSQTVLLPGGGHFHIILNGAYTDDEIAMADQRCELVSKVMQGMHAEETALATTAAEAFVERTGLPAHHYSTTAHTARNVEGNPYLWARNLLANRLYQRPVVYFEPYAMNGQDDYNRIQAGDYEGLRDVNGSPRTSIFRDYAGAVAEGLARYYRQHRRLQ